MSGLESRGKETGWQRNPESLSTTCITRSHACRSLFPFLFDLFPLPYSVSILCDPADYSSFLTSYTSTKQVPAALRHTLALKAFTMTAAYDAAISSYFRKQYASADGIDAAPAEDKAAIRENAKQLTLRYGINPHQKPAQAWVPTGKLPFSGEWESRNGCTTGYCLTFWL